MADSNSEAEWEQAILSVDTNAALRQTEEYGTPEEFSKLAEWLRAVRAVQHFILHDRGMSRLTYS